MLGINLPSCDIVDPLVESVTPNLDPRAMSQPRFLILADGDFGPATQASLQAAQTAEGLNPDGNYGPQTAAALAWPTMDDSGDISCEKQP